ncbi:class I SAM-dependent methyltransferase [Brevibacillus laterosporus]|uniref:Class I SAM-dependent methyltransferase n=1 Tax=Brevibacillus laterosporus TaxID=1465 RepID=A0AAP3DLF1_BRELA|nr:class I SAM-dependent methyltransferase [Brevibacillus laterosporus]MCR8983112.1 class I SAM-dependent methyltransferase [Brevibacillus laterosporus]MCZ0810268.1 class I SAM-dependent methyltransferase [Brevibacillus laterosporus]MCZ0828866.1 class I SAM-dependent methyltransferase [Brevibacillus laterosporus]MCZ0852889.1 class I SAM-dependent methyltransferase [Brevibacillus laterosporus]
MKSTGNQDYIPALKFHWLTRLYDPALWGMKEVAFKGHLVNQANLMPEQRILDLACGTGTLTLMLKQAQPEAEVTGLDADPNILSIARNKAEEHQVALTFQQGMSFELPFEDNHLDHAFSSLFFHHLTREMKRNTIQELLRTLRPGGEVHIIDFGKPHNVVMRAAFFTVQLLDGFETTADHVTDVIPELLEDTGFEEVRPIGDFKTRAGSLRAYSARKPA